MTLRHYHSLVIVDAKLNAVLLVSLLFLLRSSFPDLLFSRLLHRDILISSLQTEFSRNSSLISQRYLSFTLAIRIAEHFRFDQSEATISSSL